LEVSDTVGAYFNGLDYGDKGSNLLVLFGAPISYEDNVDRAMSFINILKQKTDVKMRVGITEGVVYAGYVGGNLRSTYTVLGDRVNLAARFMMKAGWGEIWLSENVSDKIINTYNTQNLGEFFFKGKSVPIKVFKLLNLKPRKNLFTFDTNIIGRKNELEKSQNFINAIKSNQNPGILYIYGEPGIGKSRILAEINERIDFDCYMFLFAPDNILRKSLNPFTSFLIRFFDQIEFGVGSDDNLANFEKSWNEIVEKIEKNENATNLHDELRRTKSLIGALVGLYWQGSLYEQLDAKGRFENTIFAIKDFFKALSLVKPLILAIDDYQWLDSDSQEVLKVLLRQIDDSHISIIIVARPNDDGSLPKIQADSPVKSTQIDVSKMGRNCVAELVKEILEIEGDDRLLDFVMQRSEGNPFYIEQFCLYLKDNDLLKLNEGVYSFVSTDEIRVPDEVNAILVSRIDRLSSSLKEVVFTASVMGRQIDIKVLSHVLQGKDVYSFLVEGESELIWMSATEIVYTFRHALLREAAYNMQLKARLRQIHHITAESIEKVYSHEEKYLSDIAYHYYQAEIKDKARDYLLKAADYAREHYQNENAIELYLKLIDILEEPVLFFDVRKKLASVFRLIGRWSDAEKEYRNALVLSAELENDEKIAEIMCDLGKLLLDKGEYDEARTMLNDALIIFDDKNNQKGKCLVVGYIGLIYYYKGDLDNAVKYFYRRLNIATDMKDSLNMAVSYRYLGGVSYYKGEYRQALQYYQHTLMIAEELESEIDIAFAKGNLGLAYTYLNDFDNALKYYSESIEIYQKFGDKDGISYTDHNMGELYLWRGDWERAMIAFKEQLSIANELGSSRQIAMAQNNIGNIYKQQKNYEEAEKYYHKAIEIAENLTLKNILCEFYYELAELYFEMGQSLKANEFDNKSYELSKMAERKEFVFKSELLSERIGFAINKEDAVKGLKSMLAKAESNGDMAEILFWLYFYTRELHFKEEAQNLYKQLYDEAPRYLYKERLSYLR